MTTRKQQNRNLATVSEFILGMILERFQTNRCEDRLIPYLPELALQARYQINASGLEKYDDLTLAKILLWITLCRGLGKDIKEANRCHICVSLSRDLSSFICTFYLCSVKARQ